MQKSIRLSFKCISIVCLFSGDFSSGDTCTLICWVENKCAIFFPPMDTAGGTSFFKSGNGSRKRRGYPVSDLDYYGFINHKLNSKSRHSATVEHCSSGNRQINHKLGERHTMHSALEYKEFFCCLSWKADQSMRGKKTQWHFAFQDCCQWFWEKTKSKFKNAEGWVMKKLLEEKKNVTTKQLVKEKSVISM